MPGLKEIESRLRTVQNTKKITYAMKLVAAAKLRKAQEAVQRSRSYSDSLAALSAELSTSDASYALMEKRETVKNVRLVVIGGARGLCGGYNSNLHRKVEAALTEIQAKHPGATVSATLLGRKPAEYFRRVNRSYVKSLEELPEDVSRWPIDDVCREIEADFTSGAVDAVYLIFTRFKSALSQTPTVEMILPLDADALTGSGSSSTGDGTATSGVSIFEPSPREVFTAVLPRVFRTKVRQAALDAKASETGA
ncbi:MAG: ATP synthase F1 subunit gamma, partial [Proteobacteria bacterium]|nr:ATP synthase F1 subunit gamma [Pseudomonadota bacterium]